MPRWLDRLLGRPEIRSLPVAFEIEENPQGRHEVRVYRIVGGVAEQVRDPAALTADTAEIREVDGRRIRYCLAPQDVQTLAALRSMAPEGRADGTWVFDMLPAQLAYLRRRANVREGPRSRSLTISDAPERPSMAVSLGDGHGDGSGLAVTFGFADGQGKIAAVDRVVHTSGGDYARVGQRFVRMPANLGRRDRALLRSGAVTLPPERIPGFFLRDLVVLGSGFDAVLVGDAAEIQVLDADAVKPVIKLDTRVRGWLDFDVRYDVAGKQLSADLLRNGADADGYVRVNDKTWVAANPEHLDAVEARLEKLGAVSENGRYRLPAHQFATVQEFVAGIGGRQVASEAYRGFLDELTGFHADPGFRLAPEAEARLRDEGIALRPYQREGIQWMDWLGRHQLHGLLADDMGLGKTLQTIAALRLAYEREAAEGDKGQGPAAPGYEGPAPAGVADGAPGLHSLVIAPRSVLSHWEREIGRCFPEIRTCRYHGPGRDPARLASPEPTVFITTYSTAANDIGALVRVPFFYVILDEATYIKNPGARRTRAIKRINGAHRLALSGTPVENRPAELWSLFDYLMPGHLGRYGAFTRTFESTILSGDLAASGRLGQRVRPFMLRRLKADVAKDLPPKVPIRESCELTPEQRQLYGGLQDAMKQARTVLEGGGSVNYAMSILPVLLRLKQICDHPALVRDGEPAPRARDAQGPDAAGAAAPARWGEWAGARGAATRGGHHRRARGAEERADGIMGRSEKFDWIIAKAEEIVGRGEQVVIFSHFLGMLDLLGTALADRGIGTVRIDGSTRDRQGEIDRFTNDGVPVALCSLKATSMGINLQTANHVIHADRWWNPAAEDQATDRVHRIGQDKTVYVYYVVTEGTLEERIDALLERKRGIAGQILDDTAQGLQGWTREELLEVLRPLDGEERPGS